MTSHACTEYELVERTRSILLLDWQKTTLSRARVREAIEDTLDAGLPRAYSPEVESGASGGEGTLTGTICSGACGPSRMDWRRRTIDPVPG